MHILSSRIKELSRKYFDDIVDIRRHLHQNPELSMQEFKTAAFITEKLTGWGFEVQTGIAGTGLVGLLRGDQDGNKVIALRADMDALPITETTDVPWKSLNEGVMHACGHDMHMSALLGACRILAELKQHWGGTLKAIFQPSEETLPGGASLMIQEGVLQNPAVDSIFGQHVSPQYPAGKVGIRSGMYMASTDEIYLTVKGKGGHAAMPHLLVDPVLAASHIVVGLQQVVSRNATPWVPSVLSFGKIVGEGRTNVIPNEVKLEGTFRTFDEQWRPRAHEKIRQIAENIASSMGAACEVNIVKGYPYLTNNEQLADNFRKYATEYLGGENLIELDLAMTAEDFAFYSQEIPACFYRFGTGNTQKGIVSALHTPDFNVDESALETAMGLMAWVFVNEVGGI